MFIFFEEYDTASYAGTCSLDCRSPCGGFPIFGGYMGICVYIYINIYAYTYLYVHIYIYIYTSICISTLALRVCRCQGYLVEDSIIRIVILTGLYWGSLFRSLPCKGL